MTSLILHLSLWTKCNSYKLKKEISFFKKELLVKIFFEMLFIIWCIKFHRSRCKFLRKYIFQTVTRGDNSDSVRPFISFSQRCWLLFSLKLIL